MILQGELEWGIYMNEQQFRVNDLVKFNYSEITEYIDEEHTPTPLRNDEVCELLNEQQDTIQSLKEENEQLRGCYKDCKKMLSEAIEENELLECKEGVYNVHSLRKDYEQLKEENEELKRKLDYCEHEHFLDSLGGSNKWFGMGGF